MRTLYESILGKDYDIDSAGVKKLAAEKAVAESTWGHLFPEEGEIELTDDHTISIDFGDNFIHELLFDDLCEKLKPLRINHIIFNQHVLLNTGPYVYENITITSKYQIEFSAYSIHSGGRNDKVQFKRCKFNLSENIHNKLIFKHIDVKLSGSMDVHLVQMLQGQLDISRGCKFNVNKLVLNLPAKNQLHRMFRMGFDFRVKGGKYKNEVNGMPCPTTDEQETLSKTDPCLVLTGIPTPPSLMYLFVIVPETGGMGVGFTRKDRLFLTSMHNRHAEETIIEMSNDWKAYILPRADVEWGNQYC
jgi:hypothetical protein